MTATAPAAHRPGLSRFVVPGLIGLALLPVAYMGLRTSLALRNAAYWDEIETVLDFLLKVQAAPTGSDVLAQLFSFGNEHRTVTSRLLFAVSYWLTGTVNFTVIGVIGNLFLFGVCGVLIATAGTAVRRLQLAVVLAGLLFQLQHFENFFWAGSSIDHFQVVALATAALAALAHRSAWGVAGACVAATLATFTLAQGLLVWPVGALALAHARRWEHLKVWSGVAVVALGSFFTGFNFNTGHAIGDFSLAGLARLGGYWLALLGAPVALGDMTLAPLLGAALLLLLATQLRPAVLARERLAVPLAAWAVGALLLVAVGRVDVVGGHVHSRYYVLSGLVWALVIFLLLNARPDPARPYRGLRRAIPLLVAFNLAANLTSAHDARSWIICRDSALENFLRTGRDGTGPFHLHPVPDYTNLTVRRVEQAGIYRLPRLCREQRFPAARPAGDILYFVDRLPVTDTLAAIEGWAGIRGLESKPGQIHVVLQSDHSRHIFTTLPMERLDVSSVHRTERWRQSGFRFQIRRWLLPAENFQLGLLVQSVRGPEYIMTAHRLDLTGPGRGILATGP
jgi:hypothetical protein